MDSEPAVEVTGLVKRYGPKTAVDGLDLTVRRGTVTAVLGPNGAGKTTTIETCEGFRRPDAGTVRVLGLDPVADAAALRPRVGVMLQAAWASTPAPVRSRCSGTPRSCTPTRSTWTPWSSGSASAPAAGPPTMRLSGGQQQRLALAMAVVGRPELVFLDEPTAGLDPQARRATWELVRDLRRDGVTVVLTTHHLDEAEQLADEVAIVDGGRVIAGGTVEQLCRGGSESSLHFDGPAGLDLGSLHKVLPDGASATEPTPGSYRVEAPLGPELLATVTAWCASVGVMPERLTVRRRSLEDVFLELTGRELR